MRIRLDYPGYFSDNNTIVWDQIIKYMKDHPETYRIEADDKQVYPKKAYRDFLMIAKEERLSPFEDDKNGFRHAIDNLAGYSAINTSYLTRENIYRLLFVLKIDSIKNANNLLMYYLHQNELSMRSLKEFLVMAAIHIGASWAKLKNWLTEYEPMIRKQYPAPLVLEAGYTLEVQDEFFDTEQTAESLKSYLKKLDKQGFFARLNNTHYCALFDDRIEKTIRNGRVRYVITDDENNDHLRHTTVTNYYKSLFGLYPIALDFISGVPLYASTTTHPPIVKKPYSPIRFSFTYLEQDDLQILSHIFPDAFHLHKKALDPSWGSCLLIILDMMSTKDYLNHEAFSRICDQRLIESGFREGYSNKAPCPRFYIFVNELFSYAYNLFNDTEIHHSYITLKECFFQEFKKALYDMNSFSDFLTKEEISELISIFPDAFLTYSQFSKIVQRKNPLEPTQELYFLHVLERMDESDYQDYDSFITACNSSLIAAGFPAVNEAYPFNALVIDVYHYTFPDNDGRNYMGLFPKERFLSNLREAFRDIIDYRNPANKQNTKRR